MVDRQFLCVRNALWQRTSSSRTLSRTVLKEGCHGLTDIFECASQFMWILFIKRSEIRVPVNMPSLVPYDDLGIIYIMFCKANPLEMIFSYHLRKVQILFSADQPARVWFAWWYLNQCTQNGNFPTYVLLRDGVFKQHNAHLWVRKTPAVWDHMLSNIASQWMLGWYGRRLIIRALLVTLTSDISKLSHLFGTWTIRLTSSCAIKAEAQHIVSIWWESSKL